MINFRVNNYDIEELYKDNNIFRISDYIKLLNCLFVRDVLAKTSIPPFYDYLIKQENLHQYNTRHAKQTLVMLTQRNTDF